MLTEKFIGYDFFSVHLKDENFITKGIFDDFLDVTLSDGSTVSDLKSSWEKNKGRDPITARTVLELLAEPENCKLLYTAYLEKEKDSGNISEKEFNMIKDEVNGTVAGFKLKQEVPKINLDLLSQLKYPKSTRKWFLLVTITEKGINSKELVNLYTKAFPELARTRYLVYAKKVRDLISRIRLDIFTFGYAIVLKENWYYLVETKSNIVNLDKEGITKLLDHLKQLKIPYSVKYDTKDHDVIWVMLNYVAKINTKEFDEGVVKLLIKEILEDQYGWDVEIK